MTARNVDSAIRAMMIAITAAENAEGPLDAAVIALATRNIDAIINDREAPDGGGKSEQFDAGVSALAPLAAEVRAAVLAEPHALPTDPHALWELAKAMPKIAGPWERWLESDWQRRAPSGKQLASVLRQPYGADVDLMDLPTVRRASVADGLRAADAALVAAGYVLVGTADDVEDGK